jgi:hypothetical protein
MGHAVSSVQTSIGKTRVTTVDMQMIKGVCCPWLQEPCICYRNQSLTSLKQTSWYVLVCVHQSFHCSDQHRGGECMLASRANLPSVCSLRNMDTYCCCSCSPPCTFLSVLAIATALALIATIPIALLIPSKATTTMTTTGRYHLQDDCELTGKYNDDLLILSTFFRTMLSTMKTTWAPCLSLSLTPSVCMSVQDQSCHQRSPPLVQLFSSREQVTPLLEFSTRQLERLPAELECFWLVNRHLTLLTIQHRRSTWISDIEGLQLPPILP